MISTQSIQFALRAQPPSPAGKKFGSGDKIRKPLTLEFVVEKLDSTVAFETNHVSLPKKIPLPGWSSAINTVKAVPPVRLE
jgi:hypothetical protein